MIEVLRYDSHAASASIYARVFDHLGRVFDFDDDTWNTLAGGTTPYKTATERADLDGTALSAYDVPLDLGKLNDRPEPRRFSLGWYVNGSPAAADGRLSDLLDFTVQSGRLGTRAAILQADLNVKSTSGDTLQIAVAVDEEQAGLVEVAAIGGTDFTATNATNVVNSTNHGLADTNAIVLTGGDLPNGLDANTVYYVRDASTSTFNDYSIGNG